MPRGLRATVVLAVKLIPSQLVPSQGAGHQSGHPKSAFHGPRFAVSSLALVVPFVHKPSATRPSFRYRSAVRGNSFRPAPGSDEIEPITLSPSALPRSAQLPVFAPQALFSPFYPTVSS